MTAALSDLMDERRRCADLVLWYQNRVLRLEIAIAELVEGMARQADTQPVALPQPERRFYPIRQIRPKSTSGTTHEIRQVFAALNGGTVSIEQIYTAVAGRMQPNPPTRPLVGNCINQLCARGEIRRVGRGLFANLEHHE